ncbi:MAG: hypothetical protein AB7T49_19310 [Oligoflexales bacterium]
MKNVTLALLLMTLGSTAFAKGGDNPFIGFDALAAKAKTHAVAESKVTKLSSDKTAKALSTKSK